MPVERGNGVQGLDFGVVGVVCEVGAAEKSDGGGFSGGVGWEDGAVEAEGRALSNRRGGRGWGIGEAWETLENDFVGFAFESGPVCVVWGCVVRC